jgi:hypothetical protein
MAADMLIVGSADMKVYTDLWMDMDFHENMNV